MCGRVSSAELLDFSDVIIRGTGAGLEPIKGVDAPLEFRRRVLG